MFARLLVPFAYFDAEAPWRTPCGAASPGIPPEILRMLNLEQAFPDVYISRASIGMCLKSKLLAYSARSQTARLLAPGG
jgi:hypothetical protein